MCGYIQIYLESESLKAILTTETSELFVPSDHIEIVDIHFLTINELSRILSYAIDQEKELFIEIDRSILNIYKDKEKNDILYKKYCVKSDYSLPLQSLHIRVPVTFVKKYTDIFTDWMFRDYV